MVIFTIYDNCKDSFAFNFPFWQHLSKQEQDGFCENISQVYFEKGEHIHSGNDKCLGVLFVKKGHIRVYMLSDEGREITLFRLFDG
ncbi:MAG: cyclic nucleotide-binding domain-containing protein, partial [Oscillospiraceae bacterium]